MLVRSLLSLLAALPACAATTAPHHELSNGAPTTHNIIDFGATPNDQIDDTAAIQSAIDAACASGLPVFIPAGTFLVSKGPAPGPFEPWVILKLSCPGLTIQGESQTTSIIKVDDNQAPFESLIASPMFPDDVSGLTITDLTLDGNSANNPAIGDESFDDLYLEKRYALRVYLGNQITIQRTRFTAWNTVNCLVTNGTAVSEVLIEDCLFDNLGDPNPTAGDWDHSSIYTDCDGAIIRNNTFISAGGPGTFGVRTAIETHGPNQLVEDNLVDGFTTGINATGVSALGSPVQIIQRNQFLNVSDGIRIWAFEVEGNTPGEPVLTDLIIRDNIITIDVDGWRATQDAFNQAPRAIELFSQSDGIIERLTIQRNAINFTNQGNAPRPYDQFAVGIGFIRSTNPDVPTTDLRILDNTITNSPASGIFLDANLDQSRIQGNTITAAGSATSTFNAAYRTAIVVAGSYKNTHIDQNCIKVPNDTNRIQQAYWLFPQAGTNNTISRTAIVGDAAPSVTFLQSSGNAQASWTIETPTTSCATCPTDLDNSGATDLADLNLILANFGATTSTGDTNNDGTTDLADLNALLAAFGNPCP